MRRRCMLDIKARTLGLAATHRKCFLSTSKMKLFLCVALLATCAWAHHDVECGKPKIQPKSMGSDRIEGGEEAVPGSWPWVVQINNADGHHLCSGVLITEQHVLTAAKCFLSKKPVASLKVHLGSHSRDKKTATEFVTTIEEACLYKGYDGGHENNIAILTLKGKIPMGDTIHPACVPLKNDTPIATGYQLYAAGWGHTHEFHTHSHSHDHDHDHDHDHEHDHGHDHSHEHTVSGVLKQALVNAVANNNCYDENNYEVPRSVFCTVYNFGSPCMHDVGGPLVQRVNGVWTLFGIVSGGAAGCKVGEHPMLHTRVSLFESFIGAYTHAKSAADKAQCDLRS